MCIPLGEPSCFSYNHTLTKNYFFLFSTMMQLVGVLDNNTLLFGSLYFPDPCPLLGSQPPPWSPICIYRPWPKFVFTNFGPQLVFTGPDQNFTFTGTGHSIVFTNSDPGYSPQFVLTSPDQDFTTTTTATSTITTTTPPKPLLLRLLPLPLQLLLLIITRDNFTTAKSVLNDP